MGTPLLRDYLLDEFAVRLEAAISKCLPAFLPRATKPWQTRIWQCEMGESLTLFVCVVWWRQRDGFALELAWSDNGELPSHRVPKFSAAPNDRQQLIDLSDLWSAGGSESGWPFIPHLGSVGTQQRPVWMFNARRGMEREFEVFYAALRCADTVVADAAGRLAQYGIPYLRGVAAAHGVPAVRVDQDLPVACPQLIGPQGRAGDITPACVAPRFREDVPDVVSATGKSLCAATRRGLRHHAAVWHRELPRFWSTAWRFTPVEAIAVAIGVGLLYAFFAPRIAWPAFLGGGNIPFRRWFVFAVGFALMVAGVMNPWARYQRRLRRLSKRSCSDDVFIGQLAERKPGIVGNPELVLAVRRAYARALDLPAEVVLADNARPSFHTFDWPPTLHEFAIYLSELLPSKPDPFILGNLLARKKRRAGILDFIEATDEALREIDKAEPHGRVYK